MLQEESQMVDKIKEILEKQVFPKVNAASQEAAEAVITCIKEIEKLESIGYDIDRRTRNSQDFAGEHEELVKETIEAFSKRHLHTFLFVSDHKCDNNIVAGSMPEKGLVLNTIQTLINIPETMRPVLAGIGFPPDCVDKCVSVHEMFEKMGRPNIFKQMIEGEDSPEEEEPNGE